MPTRIRSRSRLMESMAPRFPPMAAHCSRPQREISRSSARSHIRQIDGARRAIEARYKIAKAAGPSKCARITIALGDYDHSRALTINPVLLFSTLFGGTLTQINGAAIDSGRQRLCNRISRSIARTASSFFQPTHRPRPSTAQTDAFVSKISADGSTLLYPHPYGREQFRSGQIDSGGWRRQCLPDGGDFFDRFSRDGRFLQGAPGNGDGFVAKFGTTGAVTWRLISAGSEFDEPFSDRTRARMPEQL